LVGGTSRFHSNSLTIAVLRWQDEIQFNAGVYNNAWHGPITIRLESGSLVISFDHTPSMTGDLEHWQYDTFKAPLARAHD